MRYLNNITHVLGSELSTNECLGEMVAHLVLAGLPRDFAITYAKCYLTRFFHV